MAKFGNRCKETTDTNGTGSLDLNGAPTGFRAFADEFTNGADEISYLIVDDPDSPTEYEYGKGTFNSGSPDTFDRDTVEGSSNSDAKVSFSTGTKTIIASPTAADFALLADAAAWAQKLSNVRAITSSDNQVSADNGKLIDADSSALSPATLNYTLLAEATAGDGFYVSVINTGASGAVVIKDDAAATVYTLLGQGHAVTLRCDATSWHVESEVLPTVSQAVAEAGTATDKYAFTPQRVAQAAAVNAVSQADQAAVEAETDEDSYVPPDLLNFNPGVAKGWINFDMAGNINASRNVDSLTDSGTGDFTINWDTDFSGANYAIATGIEVDNAGVVRNIILNTIAAGTTGVGINNGSSAIETNVVDAHVVVFGDQ